MFVLLAASAMSSVVPDHLGSADDSAPAAVDEDRLVPGGCEV